MQWRRQQLWFTGGRVPSTYKYNNNFFQLTSKPHKVYNDRLYLFSMALKTREICNEGWWKYRLTH